MSNPVRAIPEGYHSISPAITCKDAARAIDFYKSVFSATEIMRMPGPGGVIMHAELRIGDSIIFINDENPGMAVETTLRTILSSVTLSSTQYWMPRVNTAIYYHSTF